MGLELEVRQQVVVSTAHMQQNDNVILWQVAHDKPHLVREFPYGWELIVATEDHQKEWEALSSSTDLSDGLLCNLLRLWQAVPELYSVVFDCDGPHVEGLDEYEW